MAVFLSPVGGAGAQFFDNNGSPLSGGKLYTYAAGTTTPETTYTSSVGNVAQSNPIILDSAGRVSGSNEIWLTEGVAYKFVLKTDTDVLLATWDQISGINSLVADTIPYDDTFANVETTVQNGIDQSLRGNTNKKHFAIGAIPRCTAGVFALINDSGHDPLNVTSVTQPDSFNIRINYAKTATKINNFVVGVDDALAPYGVICGGDVGTSYANILAFAPFDFYCDHNSPDPFIVLNPLWQPSLGVGINITKPDAATVRVTHTGAVTNDPVVASIVGGNLLLTPVVSFNTSQIDIIMHGDASGYIAYDGAAWDQSFSNNLTKPSMTWVAGNNLRIDHGVANSQDRVPIITGHAGAYIPQIVNIGSTYFEVAFYDYAGTKVTTPNTSMQFWYRRNLLVPSVWPDATIVSVKRGLCQVPSANFSNVAGNNLWVTGMMEY